MHRRSQPPRWVARLAVAALVAGTVIGVTGGPAGAGKCANPAPPQADGRIRTLPAGPLLGNGIYNLDGASQSAFGAVDPGDKANFELTYRNASTKTRTITATYITLSGDFQDFRIKYFRGDRNISDAFGNGKQFKSIPPGSTTPPVRVQVRMKKSASQLDVVAIDLRGAYGKAFPICGDTVEVEAGPLN